MKRFSVVTLLALILGICSVTISCGGSSNNTSSGLEIKAIAEIPLDLIDPSKYDLSLATTSPSFAIKSITPGKLGGFSRAGCEADQARNRILREALYSKMILCYIQELGSNLNMDFGEDHYNYYNIGKLPIGPKNLNNKINMKLALKKTASTTTIQMCESDTKVMEFSISTHDGLYSGEIVDIWPGENSEKRRLVFSSDGIANNFTFTNIEQSYSSKIWGYGTQFFDATPTSVTIQGHYNDIYGGQNNIGSTYAKFDFVEGTSKYNFYGTYPAMMVAATSSQNMNWYNYLTNSEDGLGLSDSSYICCNESGCNEVDIDTTCEFLKSHDRIESFQITGTSPDFDFIVIDESSFYEDVYNEDLQIPEIEPLIAFQSSDFIDCGSSLTNSQWAETSGTINTRKLQSCTSIQNEIQKYQDKESCQQLEEKLRQISEF